MIKELGKYSHEERSQAISQLVHQNEWEQYTPHQRAQKLLALLNKKRAQPRARALPSNTIIPHTVQKE
ncbi:MAG: hypothetical protein PHT95_05960 [Candidatus Omnitrophica bacterium]|nr:hypothetical protein [Candidatus Omnitrophota bacterium]